MAFLSTTISHKLFIIFFLSFLAFHNRVYLHRLCVCWHGHGHEYRFGIISTSTICTRLNCCQRLHFIYCYAVPGFYCPTGFIRALMTININILQFILFEPDRFSNGVFWWRTENKYFQTLMRMRDNQLNSYKDRFISGKEIEYECGTLFSCCICHQLITMMFTIQLHLFLSFFSFVFHETCTTLSSPG